MEKQQLLHILEHPLETDKKAAEELQDILIRYPWFQPARVLLLKYYRENDVPQYQKQLPLTAAYTSQRGILFEFLHSQGQEKPITVLQTDNTETGIKDSAKSISKKKKKKKKKKSEKKQKESVSIPKAVVGNTVTNEPEEIPEKKLSYIEWVQKLSFKPNTHKQKNPVLAPDMDKRKKKMQIIDDFLRKQPKIKPKPDYQPAEALSVEENLRDSRFLMTETLAKLYVKQGKYDKALKAYEILILKYPEKSRYFASQMENIRHLQKENKK